MEFKYIPPTAFPKLQQIIVRQTQVHNISFESYLPLCEFVQNVWLTRLRALNIIASCVCEEAQIKALVKRLRSAQFDSLDHHGSVFSLYLLGAYQDAAELVEEYFEQHNSTIADAIKKITSAPYTRGALQQLTERLNEFLHHADARA